MHHCTVEEIAALGTEINRNLYRIVRLAARYDRELDWYRQGFSTPGLAIAHALDIHTSTAREWIRVGHALDHLPHIHDAFLRNELSYAKTRMSPRSRGRPRTHLGHAQLRNQPRNAFKVRPRTHRNNRCRNACGRYNAGNRQRKTHTSRRWRNSAPTRSR